MSYRWLAIAVRQKAPSTHAYAVLCALAEYADEKGECWPSQKKLAVQTQQTTRSVANQINALEKSGHLERAVVQGRRGYRLIARDHVKDVHLQEKAVHVPEAQKGESYSCVDEEHSQAGESHAPPSKPISEPVNNLTPYSPQQLLLPDCKYFEDFWTLFPKQRRGNREKALRAYRKALKEKRTTEEEIINGVKAYQNSSEVRNGYAKGAAAWLSDDRWDCDYSQKTLSPGSNGYNPDSALALALADQTRRPREEQGSGNIEVLTSAS